MDYDGPPMLRNLSFRFLTKINDVRSDKNNKKSTIPYKKKTAKWTKTNESEKTTKNDKKDDFLQRDFFVVTLNTGNTVFKPVTGYLRLYGFKILSLSSSCKDFFSLA